MRSSLAGASIRGGFSLRYSALKVNGVALWHSGSREQGFRVIAGGEAGAPYGCEEICGSGINDEDGRVAAVLLALTAKSALALGDYGLPHALIP